MMSTIGGWMVTFIALWHFEDYSASSAHHQRFQKSLARICDLVSQKMLELNFDGCFVQSIR